MKFYAHSLEGSADPTRWQELEDHLNSVAQLASKFAEPLHSKEWGYLAGLWHDLGKYQPEFQEKLLGKHMSVEHSGVGAAWASVKDKDLSLPLSFVIAGHHAGLANPVVGGPGLPTPLKERLAQNVSRLRGMLPSVPAWISDQRLPPLPPFLQHGGRGPGAKELQTLKRSTEFWIRVLFSALVDADRLDTEAFCDPDKAALRVGYESVSILRERLDGHIEAKVEALSSQERETQVNRVRARVLAACRAAAELPSGIFSLTAPTGAGKTLSAMSFALRHAERHDMRGVIVVIPYTSIIEQNAAEYEKALHAQNVVQHHSSLDPEAERSKHGEEVTRRHELACENWDAPIVVTTSVQFFESLYSNHPSRCRKLHNIARSVVVLDEVQTLPPGFLLSIVDALNELALNYGCSVVLSTATPPALAARQQLKTGLKNVRPILPDAAELSRMLARVEYTWPDLEGPALDWPLLASKLVQCPQVLAVVHKRDDARALAEQLQLISARDTVWHLSALMCPSHRSEMLAQIKEKLRWGELCRVVSTQLVEAGVDVDFPVVFRALGGLDSIVQAAGRCNREGRKERGSVVIFRAPSSPPRGTPTRGMEVTESMLQEAGGTLRLDDPAVFEDYFRMLYFIENQDLKGAQALRQEFNFATLSREFRLIEDGFSQPVVVPYGDASARLQEVRERTTMQGLRALQPFIVNIYPNAFAKLVRAGALEQVLEGVYAIADGFGHLYDSIFGLVVGDEPVADPGVLVV